jgi:tRNA threonylcarbamoyladenosine biosynthesis protein TsaE
MWFVSLSEKNSEDIINLIAKKYLRRGLIICLTGDLGVGKTFFVKVFAKYMNIKDCVSSPSFNIVNEYYGDINLYHFDVYRIKSIFDLDYVDPEYYFCSDGVCIIEWADLIKDIIPKKSLWIDITKNLSRGNNYRLIKTKMHS